MAFVNEFCAYFVSMYRFISFEVHIQIKITHLRMKVLRVKDKNTTPIVPYVTEKKKCISGSILFFIYLNASPNLELLFRPHGFVPFQVRKCTEIRRRRKSTRCRSSRGQKSSVKKVVFLVFWKEMRSIYMTFVCVRNKATEA